MLRTLFASIALLTGSCSDATTEVADSLVGAKRLPSVELLARETLVIRDNTNAAHAYEYELAPAGALSITRYDPDEYGFLQRLGSRQKFRVPLHEAAITRKLLRRLRPEQLEGVRANVPPQGCRKQQLHASGDFAVAFIDSGTKAGSQDDKIAIFLSGYPTTCGSLACCTAPAALEAHTVVRQAVQQLVNAAK